MPRAESHVRTPARLRIETPLQLGLMLLLVSNAAAAPRRSGRSMPAAAHGTAASAPCPPSPPLTWPVVLRDVAALARAPAATSFNAGRYAYYELTAHRCPPPESRGEQMALQLVDMGVALVETELIGPAGTAAIHEGAALLDVAADALDHRPLDAGHLEEFLMAQGSARQDAPGLNAVRPGISGVAHLSSRAARAVSAGPTLDPAWIQSDAPDARGLLRYRNPLTAETGWALGQAGRFYAVQEEGAAGLTVAGTTLEQQDGLYWPRSGDTAEESSAGAWPGRRRRCRRTPGSGCGVPIATYSGELESLLLAHHGQGLSPIQARQRGIVPDPERSGWYMRTHDGQRKPFLRFQGRYFPVRTHRFGSCERMSVHAPRIARADGVRLRHPLGGQRMADIAESPATTGPQFMTQAEYNVRFRGFNSLDGARVYEQAVRNAPDVHLSQAEHRAILGYAAGEPPALDGFHRHGAPLPWQRQAFVQQTRDIRSGLARIAPHAGPVYRGATLRAELLDALTPGQTVYFRTFVRASGERDLAVRQLQGRVVPAGDVPLLVTFRMRRGAHPIGLYTLQDEAEVLIDLGRVFTVVLLDGHALELEEAGPVRQAFGQAGARVLDLS